MQRTGSTEVITRSSCHSVYSVDSFQNGISWGQHRMEVDADPRDFYSLQIKEDGEMMRLRSRYAIHPQQPLHELERHLMRLSNQGILGSSIIYFGTSSDPFFPFDSKFDASMKFLELFKRYTPGLLVIQTRSPLLVIALPVLKRLGNRCAVTIGIETNSDEVVARYSPGLPRISERLKTATALRRFGVEVTLQVSPLLPYGEWRKDAGKFAELLAGNGDFVYVRAMHDGTERSERKMRASPLARRLAEDHKFHWLRHDSAQPLYNALQTLAPEKLLLPKRRTLLEKQLNMFAA